MWVKFSLGLTFVKHDNTSFQGLQFSQLVVVLISRGVDLTTAPSDLTTVTSGESCAL